MQIHRTAPTRAFSIVQNALAQDRSISWCAAGLLLYLISLPECARASVRSLAAMRTEGRARVATALRDLEKARYLRRAVLKDPETGELSTVYEVFDHPYDQDAVEPVEPDTSSQPESGWNRASGDEASPAPGQKPLVSSTREKEPTFFGGRTGAEAQRDARARRAEWDAVEGPEGRIGRAARFLHGLGEKESALSLGVGEALKLAPLVVACWDGGMSESVLRRVLTSGLPTPVYSVPKFLAGRLRLKCPPPVAAARPAEPRPRHTCGECGAVLPLAGRYCSACKRARDRRPDDREPVPVAEGVLGFIESAKQGAAAARAAMRGLGGVPASV
ncbi:hypothetical protein [Streptomyces sp. NPDC048442]|uniref:hypothetical protein n=1 Tax=Streptomyces sp. NPDC048442 TaxID=3154823 RepID=UPI00342EB41D